MKNKTVLEKKNAVKIHMPICHGRAGMRVRGNILSTERERERETFLVPALELWRQHRLAAVRAGAGKASNSLYPSSVRRFARDSQQQLEHVDAHRARVRLTADWFFPGLTDN